MDGTPSSSYRTPALRRGCRRMPGEKAQRWKRSRQRYSENKKTAHLRAPFLSAKYRDYGIGAPAGTTQISALPLVLVPARVWMRLASIPLLAVRYFFTFSARAIASFAPALLSESGMPMTTADE